jgi:hypothetical protein
MASSVLHNVSNRLQDATKTAKKKAKAGKKENSGSTPKVKDESGLNTPHGDHGSESHEGSGEKEHVREVQKYVDAIIRLTACASFSF